MTDTPLPQIRTWHDEQFGVTHVDAHLLLQSWQTITDEAMCDSNNTIDIWVYTLKRLLDELWQEIHQAKVWNGLLDEAYEAMVSPDIWVRREFFGKLCLMADEASHAPTEWLERVVQKFAEDEETKEWLLQQLPKPTEEDWGKRNLAVLQDVVTKSADEEIAPVA